ncbi:MAG: prepilin-type N-terminal cleavage/methylation domain-containing protein [Candidatus Omnitrophota bacterium]
MWFRSKGYTLIEIIITAAIIAVGVVAIAGAFNAGLRTRADVENVDLALNIAQAKMEEVKNTDYSSLADEGPASDPDFSNYAVAVEVAEGQNPMQVDVTVSWMARGGQASVTLTTYIADY